MYILSHIKEFVSSEDVVTLPAAKSLLILIERAVSHRHFELSVAVLICSSPATRWRCAYQNDLYCSPSPPSAHSTEDVEETQVAGY